MTNRLHLAEVDDDHAEDAEVFPFSPDPDPNRQRDWPEAMRAVLDGRKVTRAAWPNHEVVVFIADGFLEIRKDDRTLHALLVSEADLYATDWIVVRES